jgi:hypothetical protein
MAARGGDRIATAVHTAIGSMQLRAYCIRPHDMRIASHAAAIQAGGAVSIEANCGLIPPPMLPWDHGLEKVNLKNGFRGGHHACIMQYVLHNKSVMVIVINISFAWIKILANGVTYPKMAFLDSYIRIDE